MTKRGPNRFEKHKAKLTIAFSVFVAALLVAGAVLLVKAARDEILRGGERYIQLREPRPLQDHSEEPGPETMKYAVGLEKKPYRMRVDEDGYIQPSRVHDNPDRSIVFLGGSTTECQYMAEGARFPYVAGRLLETALDLKVNSYNTAKSGNNSLHSLFILQAKVIPLKPKVAVVMECVNDLNFLIHMGSYYRPHYNRGIIVNKEYNPVKNFLLSFGRKRSEEDFNARDEFAAYRGTQKNYSIQEMCDLYKKNLELFVYVCRQHDIIPVLMTQFNVLDQGNVERLRSIGLLESVETHMGMPFARYYEYYHAMNNVHRIVAEQQKVVLIDLDKLVPKSSDYFYDGVHLSEKGSRLTAQIVAKALEPIVR